MAEIKILTPELAESAVDFLGAMNMPVGIEQMNILLSKNPGLSQVAVLDGAIVGIVLASYDGIKGYLNRLVVHQDHRQGGLGQQLVLAATAAQQKAGAGEILINCRPFLAKWYEKMGFVKEDSVPYVKLSTEKPANCS